MKLEMPGEEHRAVLSGICTEALGGCESSST